jgi:uncharacterized protein
MHTTREEAAKARRDHVTQRSDRPRQRRAKPNSPDGLAWATVRAQLHTRANETSDTGTFSGIASAYEQPYDMWDWYGPFTEVVTAGAGAVTLARADLDVPLVLQHDQMRRIARTTNGSLVLSESDEGLNVLAPSLDLGDKDVEYIVPKIRAGLIDEMSFAFRITRGHWSPDYTEYRIDEYDIHRGDVAIVGFGANPFTSTDVRTQLAPGHQLVSEEETMLLRLV